MSHGHHDGRGGKDQSLSVEAVENDMLDLCRRAGLDDPRAVRALVTWSAYKFKRFLEEKGTFLPPRAEAFLGPVWADALGRGIKAVNAQTRMTSKLATATIGDMLVESAVLLREDLEENVLKTSTRRLVAALHADAEGGPGIDVVDWRRRYSSTCC
jgi:hypothetical protein